MYRYGGPAELRKHLTYDGWTVYWDDANSDEDCRKIDYTAVSPDGLEEIWLDCCPYEELSKEAFAAHVALDFPPRTGLSPWRNETIIAELENRKCQKQAFGKTMLRSMMQKLLSVITPRLSWMDKSETSGPQRKR